MNTTKYICFVAIALFTFSNANAYVIHATDFEDGTAGPGPIASGMTFHGAGGNLNIDDGMGGGSYGYSSAFANSGSLSYYVSHESNMNGTTWGGSTWTGIGSNGSGSGGLVSQADALANGTVDNPLSYVDLAEGCEFTISANVAIDPTDPWTGNNLNLHFELIDANGGAAFYRTDQAPAGDPNAAVFHTASAFSSTAYTQISETITLTAAELSNGGVPLANVTAVLSSARGGGDDDLGTVLVDDFMYEVSDTCIVTVVPEPQGLAIMLTGLLGFLGFRRRK